MIVLEGGIMPVKINSNIFFPFLFSFILASTYFVLGGETGKIAGIVLDQNSGEPLVGANILIEGTMLGGTTNMDGEYFIINIPPGKYEVKFMYIGFQTLIQTDVRVSVDLTTRLDAKLQSQIMTSDDIVVVTASRSEIQKDLTSSEKTLSSEAIDALPVRSITDIVSLQAGVVKDASGDLHIRGGRTTEISYMIDGMQVLDPLNRRAGINIDDQAIEELKTITGTFNAEYGQALSGVINIVTKRGSDQFKFNITGYLGDYLSFDKDVYYVMNNSEWANAAARALTTNRHVVYDFNSYSGTSQDIYKKKPYLSRETYLDSYDPLKNRDLQFNLSGPLPFTRNKITYFASMRYNYAPGYTYGKRYFMPWGYQSPVSDQDNTFAAPDNALVVLNWYEGISAQGKVFFDVTNRINFNYGLYVNHDESFGNAGYSYKYVPDAGKKNYTDVQTHILGMKHVLSPSTFYELKGNYYIKNHKNYMYKDPYDYRYMPTKSSDFLQYVFGPDAGQSLSMRTNVNDFTYFGNPTDHGKSDVKYMSLKMDLTSQVTNRHLIKFGASITKHDLKNDWFSLQFSDADYRPIVPSESSPFHVKYEAQPREFAAFLQDKIEFQELIINIGLRYDYFDPAGKILADPMEPQIYKPFRLRNTYKYYDPEVPEEEWIEYSIAERRAFWYKKTKIKQQLSPRFGLSFPITDQGVIHFSYGHFFQNPEFRFLYDNPNFWITGPGASPLVGNADLNAERTVQYEIGLQQELAKNLFIHLAGFYRDIRDWVGTGKPIDTYQGVTYYKYENKDHASAKGVTLSGSYRANQLTLNVDYTYMSAKGTSSNPQDAYFDAMGQREPRLTLINLNWDQTHSFNSIISYNSQGWLATLIGTINSGLPYTPAFARGEVSGSGTFVGLRENSERKPLIYNLDMRIARAFKLGSFRTELFLNIQNLLDTRNANWVYEDTGQPDYTLQGRNQKDRDGNPNTPDVEISNVGEFFTRPGNFTAPRFIQMGFRISK